MRTRSFEVNIWFKDGKRFITIGDRELKGEEYNSITMTEAEARLLADYIKDNFQEEK